jgi:hypothetical protein
VSSHADAQGNRYRVLGSCPYSELLSGSPLLMPREQTVYFRGKMWARATPYLKAALHEKGRLGGQGMDWKTWPTLPGHIEAAILALLATAR